MADGAATDVGLGDLAHLDSAHDARLDVVTLEGILQRKRVHAGGEHADVVRLSAVHALGRPRHTAEDVAAAHRDGQLDAVVDDLLDLDGQLLDHLRVDAVASVAHEGLAGELEQDALVLVVFVGHLNTFRTSPSTGAHAGSPVLFRRSILPDVPFTLPRQRETITRAPRARVKAPVRDARNRRGGLSLGRLAGRKSAAPRPRVVRAPRRRAWRVACGVLPWRVAWRAPSSRRSFVASPRRPLSSPDSGATSEAADAAGVPRASSRSRTRSRRCRHRSRSTRSRSSSRRWTRCPRRSRASP